MKNPIIESYLDEFSKNYNITGLNETEKFEHLVNFCILNGEKYDEFDIEDIHVGEKGNYGLDGVAILVDGEIVTSKDEADAVLSRKKNPSVVFIFIQTKISDSFDSGEILKEFSAIAAFLQNNKEFKFNRYCKNLMDTCNYIFKQASKISEEVLCKIYYATTGCWNEENFYPLITQEKEQLKKLGFFKEIEFIPLGGNEIKKRYREIYNMATKDINFIRKATLPTIEGVESSFIGVLDANQYIKLITDSSGNIIKNIFFENIRDFLGNNPVNANIAETLRGADCELFPVLNNGVTIVAKSLKTIGDKIYLSNFQIVNGCQTSHILFKNRDKLTSHIFLPIKIIATSNDDIISKIVMATNNQTEIKNEAFEALRPFHKELEEFYRIASKNYGIDLYYERRQKQYINESIEQCKVITLSGQTKSYVATFLNCPHSVHKYYGTLIKDFYSSLYKEGHDFLPYYISTALTYKLGKILSQHARLRPYKFYIQYALKVVVMGNGKFENKNGKYPKELNTLVNILLDDNLFKNIVIPLANKIDNIAKEMGLLSQFAIRKKDFTDNVDKKMTDISKEIKSQLKA